MKEPCEICQGSRIVSLPIYPAVSARKFEANVVPQIEATYRDYACPECGLTVKEDRIAVLDAHMMIDSRYFDDPKFVRHMHNLIARRLIDDLLEGGYISFDRGPMDARMQYPTIATIGVVSKGAVASIEDRSTARGMQLAQAVAEEAIKQIHNWESASRYTGHRIQKDDAVRFIQEAVKSVRASWSKAAAHKETV